MTKINMKNYKNFAEMMNDVIHDEIGEIDCAISNEKFWGFGCDGEQATQHEGNARDLEEYKDILKYALEDGVIYWDKEIHKIWIKDLLEDFIKTLKGNISNYECWGMDTTEQKELVGLVKGLVEDI